jgi:hypothetical protein
MYTNPSNLIDTIIALLERNADSINQCVREWQPDRQLCVLKGMRPTIPIDAYPSLEIEPTSGSNQWATTRAQRPRYNLQFTLTTRTDNIEKHVEYITAIATRLVEILTSPDNLQLQVLNETKWNFNSGLVDTFILDSLVESVTYNALFEGTIRTCEFDWFALIHETYPESKWRVSLPNTPTVLRPKVTA